MQGIELATMATRLKPLPRPWMIRGLSRYADVPQLRLQVVKLIIFAALANPTY